MLAIAFTENGRRSGLSDRLVFGPGHVGAVGRDAAARAEQAGQQVTSGHQRCTGTNGGRHGSSRSWHCGSAARVHAVVSYGVRIAADTDAAVGRHRQRLAATACPGRTDRYERLVRSTLTVSGGRGDDAT
jgi:hypothetical protein